MVKEFLNMGYHVIASDLAYKGVDERAEYSHISIWSGDKDIYEQFERPDILVHLAWRDGFIHNSEAHMKDLSNHVEFLQNMIDGGVPYLTVMGSMHEVGYWEGAIDENTPCNPLSMYGVAKNALRQALVLYCKGKAVNLHWLRGFYIYGDDVYGSSIFSKIVQAVQDGKKSSHLRWGKINMISYMCPNWQSRLQGQVFKVNITELSMYAVGKKYLYRSKSQSILMITTMT